MRYILMTCNALIVLGTVGFCAVSHDEEGAADGSC